MVVAETITIDGVIDLDGTDGGGPNTYGGGGGAGGGLLLHGDVVSISGSITAIGGIGGSVTNDSGDGGGGGGGGRIKVFWGTSLSGSCAAPEVLRARVAQAAPGSR